MAEVVLVEARHHLPLIPIEALGQQRAERAGRERVDAVGNVERRKPQIGHVAERSAAQKAPGLEKAQAVPVARGDEIAAIAIVQFFGDLFARILLGPVLRQQREKITRDLGPHAFAQQAHGRARPLGITRCHER